MTQQSAIMHTVLKAWENGAPSSPGLGLSVYVQFDRTVVGAEYLVMYGCPADTAPEIVRDEKIIYTPAGIPASGAETV